MSVEIDELEYELTEDRPEDESLPSLKYEIFSYPADTTLKGYLEQWNNKQLFVPEFQRDFVWDQTRSSKLIESFLLGLPVPPTFLYKPAQSKSFWIIDGQQRIRSIVDFQKGLFGDAKFRLKGVDKRWDGKTFDELSEEERFSLETTVLRAVVIQQTNPADHTSIFHIFERLNTGGMRLSAMEVRQCVYVSSFLNKIKEWNKDENWRNILGIPKSDKRLKDCELLLRIVALYLNSGSYEKPMKKFLNDCSLDFKNLEIKDPEKNKEQLEILGNTFKVVADFIVNRLGPKPFHLKGRLNFSALDAVFVTLMRRGELADIKSKFNNLIKDEDFNNDVSFNTSDESVVSRRFSTVEKYLV